ncbi:MAG TPA: hypothetical protein VLH15_01085 [Dehalococcoidales bacterium]|nr:hypothetical protein [Dehalococcoidales bacterium]
MLKNKFITLSICFLFILGLTVFFAAPVQPASAESLVISVPASALPAESSSGPVKVKVGIYVLNIGRLDTSTGAFTVDFYLSFTSDTPSDPGRFEFINGRATTIDKSIDEPTSKFYRIQAALTSNLNLSDYPFDKHNLTIEIEDKEQTINSQVYEVYYPDSGIDPIVQLAGWNISGFDAEVVEHRYELWDTTFSKYIFNIQIERITLAAILKTLLPAFIIVMVGLLSLLLSPDKIIPRLTLNTGAFTGAVLFHLNMTSSLPPLGYLTVGDRFMLINYLALTLSLISTLLALYYVDKKLQVKADRIHKLALAIVPLIWLGCQSLNFLLR